MTDMETEADREAREVLEAEVAKMTFSDQCDSSGVTYPVAIRAMQAYAARHRTASTAALTAAVEVWKAAALEEAGRSEELHAQCRALTAEIQRLQEKVDEACSLITPPGNVWSGDEPTWQTEAFRVLTDLSTPSEVSEPDQIGGVFAGTPGMFDKPNPDEVAGTYSAFEVSEPVADHNGGEGLIKRIDNVIEGNERDQYVIGDVIGLLQEVRAALATPPNTNVDAVLEALEEVADAAKGARGWFGPCNDPEMSAALTRLDSALATLAKHGGTEG